MALIGDLPEPMVKIEYSVSNSPVIGKKLQINPVVLDEDNAVTDAKAKYKFKGTRSFLNESVTSPSRISLFMQGVFEINCIYNELKLDNNKTLEASYNIIQTCILNNKRDFKISKTGENEILIYRKRNGEFHNLLIDEEGDISFMFIGSQPGEERVKYFSSEKGFNYQEIVSLI